MFLGCAALNLSPDVVGVYHNAQSALTSRLKHGRLCACNVKCLKTCRQLLHHCERLLSSIQWLYVTHMLIPCYVHILTLQKPHIPAGFNTYLVISKCVTAVKVSNFSGNYLRKRSTLDIGVLGYIGIVWPKEHSPEVLSLPPVTPCIYVCVYVYLSMYIR